MAEIFPLRHKAHKDFRNPFVALVSLWETPRCLKAEFFPLRQKAHKDFFFPLSRKAHKDFFLSPFVAFVSLWETLRLMAEFFPLRHEHKDFRKPTLAGLIKIDSNVYTAVLAMSSALHWRSFTMSDGIERGFHSLWIAKAAPMADACATDAAYTSIPGNAEVNICM
jgi:hypothetical protein